MEDGYGPYEREDDLHLEKIAISLCCLDIETNQDVISVGCWNLSQTCWINKPVTHVYKKIASYSSSAIFCGEQKPMILSLLSRAAKKCLQTPSLFCICSGCLSMNPSIQLSPDSADVWYGILSYKGPLNSSAVAPTTCTKIL